MAEAASTAVATLTVDGLRWEGWTELRVTRGIEHVAGGFALGLTERFPGEQRRLQIRPGSACTLALAGATVVTGRVDAVGVQHDSDGHAITVEGRDATGDLVDCSAEWPGGEFKDSTLAQIATALAKPFDVPVTVAGVDAGASFRRFAIQPGESVFEAIERACRMRAVLPMSDGRGGLILTGPGTARAATALMLGENILSAQGRWDGRERFSRYTVKGQDEGASWVDPGQSTGPEAVATDPAVGRHRPLVIVAEQPGDAAAMQTRATWEASVRRGRARRATVTTAGWRHAAGLWAPNQLVRVRDAWLAIDMEMLVVEATQILDAGGTRTELQLTDPAAFTQIALPDEEEAVGW